MNDKSKKLPGRPTVITAEVVSILTSSFHDGLTVREACWQAGISHEAYYSRIRSDLGFADKMDRAQAYPTMIARKVIVQSIHKGDISNSKWWLERKEPKVFGKNAGPEAEDIKRDNPFESMTDEEFLSLAKDVVTCLSPITDTEA